MEMMMEREVEFLPLLKAMPAQMASRWLLHTCGVTDTMIDAAEKRGEISVCGPGIFDSIIITAAGLALYP